MKAEIKNHGFDSDRLARMRGVLHGHVESGEVPALVGIVSRHGETHVEVFGTEKDPVKRDTIFRIASLTKPVAAAAAMILIEECQLRLDDPVDAFLPELANRQVLKRPDSPLDETVPAKRSITTRDLLTLRLGLGYIMLPGEFPIMKAAQEMGILTGPPQPQSLPNSDEWIRRVGTLPLIHQPGEEWMYDIGFDILGVLIARVSGQTFGDFLQARIFGPLGMKDTGFHVAADKLGRLAVSYYRDHEKGTFGIYDPAIDSQWGQPVPFHAGGGGLVSTADDYVAFCQMMLNKGVLNGERILSRPSVELMTSGQITPEQAESQPIFLDGGSLNWGFGMGIVTKPKDLTSIGTYGWTGGLGTLAFTDPQEELIGILMTQRLMDSPSLPKVYSDFQTLAYQAIN